jgi:hypothetical protein
MNKIIVIPIILIIFIIIYYIIYNNKLNNYSYDNNEIIKILIRQSARWSAAALQDKSPLIAVLHANYGAAYLWAVKDIFTSEEIEKATGINLLKFQKKISEVQDMITKKMVKLCPDYIGNHDRFLSIIAGEL